MLAASLYNVLVLVFLLLAEKLEYVDFVGDFVWDKEDTGRSIKVTVCHLMVYL